LLICRHGEDVHQRPIRKSDATASAAGVAVASRPNQPIAELIDQADRALYSAKHRGRNRVVAA